jgi:hypothetical protein
MNREETLDAAKECVLVNRNRDYADPEDNFSAIARLWNFWLSERYGFDDISALDVAMMSAFIKVARMLENPYKEDNFIDIAGYAACAAEVAEIEQDKKAKNTGGMVSTDRVHKDI